MFYAYILKSQSNGSYYIGSCDNLNKRLELHNLGFVKSTKRYRLWHVVYYQEFEDLRFAKKRELQMKAWKKRSVIENLIKHFKI